MKEKGQALIEFVLILPVILLIIVSLIDIGNIFLEKYNLNSNLETITEMYQNDQITKAKAYAAKEELNLEEKQNGETITIELSKKLNISAPILNNALGKDYIIKNKKTFYQTRSENE